MKSGLSFVLDVNLASYLLLPSSYISPFQALTWAPFTRARSSWLEFSWNSMWRRKVLVLTGPNMTTAEDGEGLEDFEDTLVVVWMGRRGDSSDSLLQSVCLNRANETNPALLKVDGIFWRADLGFYFQQAFAPRARVVLVFSATLVDPCNRTRWVSSPVNRLFNLHIIQSPISVKRQLLLLGENSFPHKTHNKNTQAGNDDTSIKISERQSTGKKAKCKLIL